MSEIFDDTNHPVSFESPLGGKLVVQSMSGDEALGRLFNYNLELLSQDFELHFDQIVGQQVTVVLDLPEDKRYFNALITEFRYLGQTDRYARYQATLRPWLWFLTRTSDCRIFQEKKVPDIIKEVFRDNGMSDFEDRLTGNYRKWEYCVQYRETDFNFISRLMEQEGIYYYFKHFEDKHELVLTDDMGTHEPFPKFETIPYCPPAGQMSLQQDDHLQHWAVTQAIQPERYAIQDFDFKKPRVNLLSRFNQQGDHAFPINNPEIYDYPGEYMEFDDGVNYVEIRLQELRSQFERVNAGGPCRGMSAGCLFTLEDYPREDQNKEYLVLSVSHQISDTGYISSGGGSSEELYRCQISVMGKETPYRQIRSTPKPIVQGPQTAIVVGPSSDEIFTDEFGRVKVQFHWDRYGQRDENSSCWIRVSQVHAGKGFGGIDIPRIGEEVIVSFMEGDPDRPLITGRVYNAELMTPFGLPGQKVVSGMKSNSTPGGGGYNEFSLNDTKGEEGITIHGQYNMDTTVENDQSNTIGNNRTTNVAVDDTESVGSNQSISVGADQSSSVGSNQSVTIGANRSVNVGASDDLSVGSDRTVNIGASNSISVSANHGVSAGANIQLDSGANTTLTAGANIALSASGTISLTAGGSGIEISAGGIKITTGGIVEIKGAVIKENS